ncbi:MAG TPA: hypothetical protein VFZ35_04875 [Sphingomicrobium sp.]
MTAVWHFYWPVFIAAAIIGIIAGVASSRRPRGQRRSLLLSGGLASLLIAMAWHWPGGAGARLTASVERAARVTLYEFEMRRVTAQLDKEPLTRTLVLSGPADDFQQRELVRILNDVPGVSSVRWDRPVAPSRGL